jgi:P27 family predicted phage terminase small subunit
MSRTPAVAPDKKKYKQSNQIMDDRENKKPIYQSQNFIPPPTLTEKELKIWNWLVSVFRETINCRVSDADVHLMETYCRAKVAADEADEELKKDPRGYILIESEHDKDGKSTKFQLKPNPNIKKRMENSQLCIKLFDQLGLSPLARARAGLKAANSKKEEDVFKEIMDRSDD